MVKFQYAFLFQLWSCAPIHWRSGKYCWPPKNSTWLIVENTCFSTLNCSAGNSSFILMDSDILLHKCIKVHTTEKLYKNIKFILYDFINQINHQIKTGIVILSFYNEKIIILNLKTLRCGVFLSHERSRQIRN